MRQQIRNIAQNPRQERFVGEIISITGVNARVRDDFERVIIAELGAYVGARVGDTVIVRNGTVVSRTAAQEPTIIFEV